MRQTIVVIALGFAVTLAAVVGIRMSTEAMAVVVGVVCGVAAAIPMSLLLLAASLRRQSSPDEAACGSQGARHPAYPPVVVIQGGQPVSSWSNGSFPAPLQVPFGDTSWQAAPRQFRIVGEED